MYHYVLLALSSKPHILGGVTLQHVHVKYGTIKWTNNNTNLSCIYVIVNLLQRAIYFCFTERPDNETVIHIKGKRTKGVFKIFYVHFLSNLDV